MRESRWMIRDDARNVVHDGMRARRLRERELRIVAEKLGRFSRARDAVHSEMPEEGITATKVGAMTLNFTNNDSASMSYTLDGTLITRQISRQIFGPAPPVQPGLAGQWQGAIIEARSNCSQTQNNGNRATYGQYDIGMGAGSSGALAISLAGVTGLQCSYSGNFSTNGARLQASGSMSCNDGKRGTWQSTSMRVTARAMSLEIALQLDTTETCMIAAILGGSRL